MPRKGLKPRERRDAPPPEFKYNSVLLARMINRVNFQGKKIVGERIVYGALDIIAEKTKEEELQKMMQLLEEQKAARDARYAARKDRQKKGRR